MRFIFALLLCMVLTATVFGQGSDNTAPSAKALKLLEQCDWIAGHWQGEALGGQFEETWNTRKGPGMMGMFKLVQNGKIVFYELMTIVPKNETLVLRLKHFSADLVGWEEKDKSVEFPFVSVTKNELQFKGLVFKRQRRNKMQIVVTTKEGDKISELVFNCSKVSRGQRKNVEAGDETPSTKSDPSPSK